MKAIIVAAVHAIKEWNPFGPQEILKREYNKKFRKARKKLRKGEPLSEEEEIMMEKEVVKLTLADGTPVGERVEPTIPWRTSTKMKIGSWTTIIGSVAVLIPYYDEINNLLLQACTSGEGPLLVLGGMIYMAVQDFIVARKTKSPAIPGKIL